MPSTESSELFISLPRVALITPFFTVDRHGEGWKVDIEEDGEDVSYEVGIDAGPGLLTGSLTVDEAEVLVGLLAFADLADGPLVRFGSLNALGTRIWGKTGYGGGGMLRLVNRLGRLSATGIVRRVEGSPRAPVFRVLSDWDLAQFDQDGDWRRWDISEKADGSYRCSQVQFSSGFMRWMATSLDVDANTFLNIRSKLGRAIYLFLPSKAYPPHRFSANRPRTMELAELLRQLGSRVPEQRATRLQIFERPDRDFSVSRELDGARLWCGKFRFEIEQRPAPLDHRVRCWIEPDAGVQFGEQTLLPLGKMEQRQSGGGRLMQEWLSAGGTPERWNTMRSREVSNHERRDIMDSLVESGVMDDAMALKNKDVIALGLQIIGSDGMHRIRSVVKSRMLESGGSVRDRAKFWMGCLKDEIRMSAKR